MTDHMGQDEVPNLRRFCGFAGVYHAYRPTPPEILLDILIRLAGTERPALVVDLGSGTGLSTRIWSDRAGQVIGIEPNADMRREAETASPGPNVSYRGGLSSATGLPDAAVDIVTVSQALHWMEPYSTFAEAARILRPGGVFAAYDCDWPPTVGWEAEQAYDRFMRRCNRMGKERNIGQNIRRWEKDGHLARIRQSGCFGFARELCVHAVTHGTAEQLAGVALSQGGVAELLVAGLGDEELGLPAFRKELEELLGPDAVPWYWTYRVRVGVVTLTAGT